MSSRNRGSNDCFQVTGNLISVSIPAMDIESLAAGYRLKPDEELLALAARPQELTSEAQLALESEMAIRGIRTVTLQNQSEARNESISCPTDGSQEIPVRNFIEEVLVLYRRNRWPLLKLIFPAVLLSYISVLVGRYVSRPLMHELHSYIGSPHFSVILREVWFITSMSYLVSWIAYCASFAAICSVVDQYYAEVGISETNPFFSLKGRLGRWIRVSLLLLFLLAAVIAATSFASAWIFRFLKQHFGSLNYLMNLAVFYLPTSFGLLLLARFGLAIPAVILDDCTVSQSMFRSDQLTAGKWRILTVLVSKAVIGGYLGGMLPFWLAGFIPHSVDLPSWFGWLLTCASLAAVTAVEPVIFIGFALLYLKTAPPPRKAEAQAVPT